MPSPTGFEARPRHRARLPSLNSVLALSSQRVVEPDLALVAHAPGKTDPVEVFENLDAALATQPRSVAKVGDLNHRILRRQLQQHSRQLAQHCVGVEQVANHLMKQPQPRHFP